jgi:hypothetical protein
MTLKSNGLILESAVSSISSGEPNCNAGLSSKTNEHDLIVIDPTPSGRLCKSDKRIFETQNKAEE